MMEDCLTSQCSETRGSCDLRVCASGLSLLDAVSGIIAAVLQGSRVSLTDAMRAGAVVGREWEWEREQEWEQEWERQWTFPTATGIGTDRVKRTCRQRRTASYGRVRQGNVWHQMDVSNRETDSVRWMYRTERRTASDGHVEQSDG